MSGERFQQVVQVNSQPSDNNDRPVGAGRWTWLFMAIGLLVLTLAVGCGRTACSEMMSKVCDDCEPILAPEWKAACLCWDDEDRTRGYGFRCKSPDAQDQDACRMTLESWDETTCLEMNRSLPNDDRLP